ncbi:MAG: Erythromycin esterase-like protein [Chloroflexi bacterium AL-W]|nr:Erythromycin esterase-like protein [Chloroflexi bacterium AL-N1]NOK67174.1 Erythromycin esterase-like protein [Chloroflexi bacterium AL-N10]NOK75332.1 Erythromycin esterase-like protein [Chloroflexi bacterium AL-N5]NOK82120.1 Erythromycin esterase-like protein [Chloroflexi bacterium AL-W]NOK89965.1 Erythromycin esterase-like protein [Chloroflexi bacterium AL-N15]
MSHHIPVYTTLDDWMKQEAIPFSMDAPETFRIAVDRLIVSLGNSVDLLGFGEALHGGEDILILRNRLFQHLVEAHGYSAIAIESSFPRARVVNDYIADRGPASYEALQDIGFSYGFQGLDANRELVEWMRQYNASASPRTQLRFYGFDSPTSAVNTDSPRHTLHFVLDYLALFGGDSGQQRRERIDALLGADADWENPAASMDPTQAVGLSAGATALRVETEDLISELHIRRPELIARSDADQYWEALQYASVARQLLNYHAVLARQADERLAELLGIRDAMMADNLAYIVARECSRGKVLVFAHNSHLQRGKVQWQLGAQVIEWWPAGAHLNEIFGAHYAVIGSGVGVSEANGIGQPEVGTLEALLTSLPDPALFIPTYQGEGLPIADIASLPRRSDSTKNPHYFPFTPASFTNFDWLVMLDSTAYTRGGLPLP